MSYKQNQKGVKSQPENPDQLKKKAKLSYLNILAGHTAGNVTAMGPLKDLGEHAKHVSKKVKK